MVKVWMVAVSATVLPGVDYADVTAGPEEADTTGLYQLKV
jgi:hypothetical protein